MKKLMLLSLLLFTGCVAQISNSDTYNTYYLKQVGVVALDPNGFASLPLYTIKISNKTYYVTRGYANTINIGPEVSNEVESVK